jgi:hypothetical protein
VSFVPVSTPNPSASVPPASRNVTFRDLATGNTLSIEVGAGAVDRGHFAVGTPTGVYGGGFEVRAVLTTQAAPIAVTYDGPMTFTATAGGPGRKTTALLRGTIDPDAHAADVVFTTDGTRYVINTRPPDDRSVAAMLDRLEAAVVADDATAIYALSTKDLRANYTAAQFVSAWQAQSATTGRRITAMHRVAVGPVVTSDLGFATVEVRWSTDVTDRNGSRITGMVGFLIFEEGEWKLWTTSES